VPIKYTEIKKTKQVKPTEYKNVGLVVQHIFDTFVLGVINAV